MEEQSVRKRLLVAAICILGLPLWFSPTQGDKLYNSAPFATVALAGHQTTGGVYCECDNPNSHLLGLTAQSDNSTHQDESTTQGHLSIELGIALTALTLWFKLRA
jgi:hypothetical protein